MYLAFNNGLNPKISQHVKLVCTETDVTVLFCVRVGVRFIQERGMKKTRNRKT